jgi:hypothetical protein
MIIHTMLDQLYMAQTQKLLKRVEIWGDSIYIRLNEINSETKKDQLIQYFQQHNINAEPLSKDSLIVILPKNTRQKMGTPINQ